MTGWTRRIRGALGMGLAWASGWVLVGILMALGFWAMGFDPAGFVLGFATLFGILGFLGGGIFSVVLRLAEGRRRFDEMSLPRFALWGGVGGLLLGGLSMKPLLDVWFGSHPVILVVATVLGAASAAGTLALARRAESDALPVADEDIAEVGLTEDERKRLLGGAG